MSQLDRVFIGDGEYVRADTAVQTVTRLNAENARLRAALDAIVNAQALKGVRDLVAGWNGEKSEWGPYARHPGKLGATLPKTTCGAIYALDEAMQQARALLGADEQSTGGGT